MGIIIQSVNRILDRGLIGIAQIETIADIKQEQSADALIVPIAGPKLKALPKVQDSGYFHRYGRCIHVAEHAHGLKVQCLS